MPELDINNIKTNVHTTVMAVFSADAAQRFPKDFESFTEQSMELFDKPEGAYGRYQKACETFLENHGYGRRYYVLFNKILEAIYAENQQCNLVLYNLSRKEVKHQLSKEDYAKYQTAH